MQPRFVRFKHAPAYLGMDRNRFNHDIRPYLPEIPIGIQGIAFDRLELDAWADDYNRRNGRPGLPKGDNIWDAKERQDSCSGTGSGISTSASAGGEFAKALEQIGRKKPSCFSRGRSTKPDRRRSTVFGRRDRSS
jgi:hypothetical protein